MKTFIKLAALTVLMAFTACSTSQKSFPVSSVTPAADIKAKKSIDNQNNHTLEITATNLAEAERLVPPGNNYSVWIVTKEYGVKNVGQLSVKNAQKTTFKTVTAFDFYEVFITVEKEGELQYPEGMEIVRTRL